MIGSVSVRDVNHVLLQALDLLHTHGKPVTAQSVANARPTIEWPGIFLTEYTDPTRCVLFDPVRDCNPFFHYLEALWIIAGRNDVLTLAHILPKMAEYSDDTESFHGAYGFRLRHWPGNPLDSDDMVECDQIERAIAILRDKPMSRQVVLSIWNPIKDLGAVTKDMPCNDMLMLKIRDGKLNMTVCNRSNDAIWGCYGANVVQFSMLLMYLAARIGCGVGTYVQQSDSFHVYEDTPYWQAHKRSMEVVGERDPFVNAVTKHERLYEDNGGVNPFLNGVAHVDADLGRFWNDAEHAMASGDLLHRDAYKSRAVKDAACVYNALALYRIKDWATAHSELDRMHADDWAMACELWLNRREEKARA